MTPEQQARFDKFYGEALTILLEKDPTLRGNPAKLDQMALMSAAIAMATLETVSA